MKISKRLTKTIVLIIIMVSFYGLVMSKAIQEEENTRKLWDSKFLKKRPNATKPNSTNTAKKSPNYRRVPSAKVKTPTTNPTNPSTTTEVTNLTIENSTFIGVTLWRLRPAQKTDELTTRILVQEETSGGVEFIPERVEVGETLLEGQRVRLSIEVPQEGYVYIIDREKYIDGTYSEPYLIFPTLRTRSGDNQVSSGITIEVPAQDDKPPYFRLRSLDRVTKGKYIGEELSILVSPQPIAGLKITPQFQKLSRTQFEEWEKKWATKTELLTLEDGVGKTYTPAEKEAGNSKEKALTQTDPLPQTLYQVAVKAGEPLLIKVPLEIKRQ